MNLFQAEGLLAPGNPLTPGEDASDKGSFYAREIWARAPTAETQADTRKTPMQRQRAPPPQPPFARQDRRRDIRFELDKK